MRTSASEMIFILTRTIRERFISLVFKYMQHQSRSRRMKDIYPPTDKAQACRTTDKTCMYVCQKIRNGNRSSSSRTVSTKLLTQPRTPRQQSLFFINNCSNMFYSKFVHLALYSDLDAHQLAASGFTNVDARKILKISAAIAHYLEFSQDSYPERLLKR